MKDLYPVIEPYQSGYLKVSDIHELYYEQCGNPDGKPVVYLHGGPGSGCNPFYRQYFNPEKYRLIMFDQRGAGRSTPHAELRENTTPLLVSDIEKLRELLNIKKWMVYGGSWGSTLALAYAQTYPEAVDEMIIYGIFLGTKEESDWLYQKGASAIFPEAWENYVSMIDPKERHNIVAAYNRKLTELSVEEQIEAAKAWSKWEYTLATANLDQSLNEFQADEAIALARLECHYLMNDCFLKPGQLLSGVERIKHIPAVIVHGRYDMVCPSENAWKLHKAWPSSKLTIVPGAGHSAKEPGMQQVLLKAIEAFSSYKTASAKNS